MGDSNIPPDILAELKEAFSLFDTDGNGHISAQEFVIILKSLGLQLSESEVQDLFYEIDLDGNGNIEFEEFVQMMMKKIRDVDLEEELTEAFKILDKDKNGSVSMVELKNVLAKSDNHMTAQEIQESLLGIQTDQDGGFSYADIIKEVLYQ